MTCSAVTRRASTGPCESCGWSSKAAHDGWERTETVCGAYLGPVVERCGHEESEHPDEGWVRFEWAETARPEGWWYYRTADLQSESVLRLAHAFEEES